MKFSLNLLRKHLKGDYTKDDVENALVSIGLEVEDVIDEGARLKDFIVAHIDHAEKHPNADRLQVCQVNTGTEILNIVCGGKNARAGMNVALARVGAVIPSTGQPLKLGKVRGVESQGMLCSAEELLLDASVYGPEDGIMDVDITAKPGDLLPKVLGLSDVIFDISITPNRADCFALYGIARDLYAYFSYHGKKVALESYDAPKVQQDSKSSPQIFNDAPGDCYSFYLTRIEGVKNTQSPSWLKQALSGFGVRSISALVDVTNYLCFDLGRPLHVFDADKVKGNIRLRPSQKGESFEALDDKTYTLDEGMLVICDDMGIISLAGIMGGKRTSVDDQTRDVLLESAWFNPVTIAKAGQALNLISDSRMRFERGIDPFVIELGSQCALSMIVELCGGTVHGTTSVTSSSYEPRKLSLSQSTLQKLTGEDIPLAEGEKILRYLGFEADIRSGNSLDVVVPSWRGDVEGEADLVEEIVRIRGVDSIESLPLPLKPLLERTLSPETIVAKVFANHGFHETMTFSFLDEKSANLFTSRDHLIHIENPISQDLTTMRPSLLSTLLQTASSNLAKGREGASLFEVGNVFGKNHKDYQSLMVAALQVGIIDQATWNTPEKQANSLDARDSLFRILRASGIEEKNIQVTREVPSYFHPGQSGAVKQGNRVLAYFGTLHPMILKHFDIEAKVAGFEVFVENLPQKQKRTAIKELSSLQPVVKDFAFVVDKTFEAGKIAQTLWNKLPRQQGFPKMVTLEDVRIFDIFEEFKEDALRDKKSVALSVTFQPEEETLQDENLTQLMNCVTTLIEKETGGKLRQ